MPFPLPLEAAKGSPATKAHGAPSPRRAGPRRRRAPRGRFAPRGVAGPPGHARAPPPRSGSGGFVDGAVAFDGRRQPRVAPTRRAAVAARLLGVPPAQLDPPRRPILLTPRRQRNACGSRPRPEPPLGAHRRRSRLGASRGAHRRRGPALPPRFPLAPPQVRPSPLARVDVAGPRLAPRDDRLFPSAYE